MHIDLHKNYGMLSLITLAALLFFSFFISYEAQAQSYQEDTHSYHSNDNRTHVNIQSRSSANGDMNTRSVIGSYSNSGSNNDVVGGTFSTDLSGSEEVPPVITNSRGEAEFEINDNERSIDFDLDVFDGENIIAAHLHCAPLGENGPVAVTLFSSASGVDINGELSSGEITDSDITANCEGIMNVNELIGEIEDENIYVNVHSEEHPNGLIRGQLDQEDDSDDDEGMDDDAIFDRIQELLDKIRELRELLRDLQR